MWMSHLMNRYNVVLMLQLLCILPENRIHVRAHVCEVGQEKNKQNGWRWFLSDKDPCSCTSIRLGGFNADTTERSFNPEYKKYVDSPWFGDGEEKIRNHYNLKCNEETTPEGTTSKGTTVEETTFENSTSEAITIIEERTSDGSNLKETTSDKIYGTSSEQTTSEGTSSKRTASETTFYQTSFKDTTSDESTTLAEECSQPMPLGMESGSIGDDQLSASSFYSWLDRPSEGRLNNSAYWASGNKNNNQWFQVKFLSVVTITEIITQGSGDSHIPWRYWITQLRIAFIDSASTLKLIRDADNNIVTFTANTNYDSVVSISLPGPIATQILRIIPTAWQGWCSFRLEVVGCK
ncbi:uncharacterized protein [Amphiura filiformis]|uniref:uncharacterized protein n=1 Tax=Amphiura filiformis TaxID=82378 RepID=UPI003B223F38